MKISSQIQCAALSLRLLLAASCARHPPEPRAVSTYVDPKLCADCHPSYWKTFRETGMARSFFRPTPANMTEDFTRGASFYHKPSDRYYQMIRRDGRYFVRRYQRGLGAAEANVMEAEIDYVMGSGNHARSYLHRTAENRLVQLPVTWYPENGGVFAMSPGYDRADHFDFRRKVDYNCFFCHDSYPQLPPGGGHSSADAIYPAQLPEGIDCQRCHGPGSAHVDAATRGRPATEIRSAILNPAHLTTERQLEVCMQCHLETTSFDLPAAVERYGRGTFSFRPGEPLADYILQFDHAPGSGREDKFEIVSSAYRLRQSMCFQKSGGTLICTTCHNPHQAPRGEQAVGQYTAACRKCHEQKLQFLIAGGAHTKDANCITCHMPKRRTDDVVHSIMTDHRIVRRKPARDLLAPLAERHELESAAYRGEVVPYYPPSLSSDPDGDLYLAVAQVAQKSNLTAGIPRLEAAVHARTPSRPEFYYTLGQGYLAAGRRKDAIAMYQTALQHDPKFLPALRRLGAALVESGEVTRGIASLEQARALDPHDAATLHELGLAYHESGRNPEALSVLTEAISRDPDLPEIYNSLGNILLESGQPDQAADSLREAVRRQPDFAVAHTGLGNVLAAGGDLAEAERQYQTAIRLEPANSPAHYGYGAALASQRQFNEAQRQLEEAVRLTPDFAEAQAILGDLYARRNDWVRATQCYREALRTQPQFGRAHLGLGTALLATRNLDGARTHLMQAAQDSNPAIRQEAMEMLQQIR
jgi:predicted CXXCH cytochrome family protein